MFAAISAATTVGSLAATRPVTENVSLTRSQQREIYFDLSEDDGGELAPPGFIARVGEIAPSMIRLRPLPARIVGLVSAVKGYDYAILYFFGMATNTLVLVDPATRQIVAAITP